MHPSSWVGRPAGELERGRFFELMSAFPTGVTVVTTRLDGMPAGLSTNAFTSVSAEPPLLLVCLDKESRTLPVLLRAGAFAVNFVAEGREELIRVFASKADDKFDRVAWRPGANGMPVLAADAIAHAECDVEQAVELGDHVAVVGRVTGGEAGGNGRPLVYYRRVYGGFAGDRGAA